MDWTEHQKNQTAYLGEKSKVLSQRVEGILVIFAVFAFLSFLLKLRQQRNKLESNNDNKSSIPKVAWFKTDTSPYISGWWTFWTLNQTGLKLFDNLREKYGRIYKLPCGFFDLTVVTDPEVITTLLASSNFSHLNKCKVFYEKIFMKEFHNSIFMSKAPVWQPQRKLLVKAFSYKSLNSYLPLIGRHTRNMIRELNSSIELAELQDGGLMEIVYRHVLRMSGELLMAEDCNNDKLELIHQKFHTHTVHLLHRIKYPLLFVPALWKLYPRKLFADFFTPSLHALMSQTSANGLESDPASKNTNSSIKSFITWMFEKQWQKQEILDNVSALLNAEHEPTCTSLETTLFLLALHQEHQTKCRTEIKKVFSRKTADNLTLNMNDLCELKHTERCIMESLRMFPPIPTFGRRLYAPLKINESLTLTAGTCIAIVPWALQHDPEYYPQPEIFDPDRFLPENNRIRVKGTYIPFSSGPRNCIGWKLSIMQLKIFLAEILKHFEITTTDTIDSVPISFGLRFVPERHYKLILHKI